MVLVHGAPPSLTEPQQWGGELAVEKKKVVTGHGYQIFKTDCENTGKKKKNPRRFLVSKLLRQVGRRLIPEYGCF
jgi:hypothetical protein